ncbi:MAG: cation diffusion facilitator family transporter [Elusimicrobia bacterium]|nr:cation diffusion facilitator family transporter [Elusimicrobiota bacterium]
MNVKNANTAKLHVVKLSVVSNTVLVIFKLIAGLVIGSVSVLSEAIHSGIDLVAALIAYVAVRSSAKPADKDHHYGHGKFENISGFIEAVLIFLAAAWIIYEAVKKLIHPQAIELIGWGILVMGLSAFVNMVVSQMLFKVGNATDSIAIKADAWHLRTDVYTSLGVMAGLFLIWLIELVWVGHHVHWIDPVIAILVALLIIKAAYNLTAQSMGDLLDGSLPKEDNTKIEGLISAQKGVISFKNLKTRKAGATRFIESEILVDSGMSVVDAHALTDYIIADIGRAFADAKVTIHIEPCEKKCPEECLPNCAEPKTSVDRVGNDS